MQTKKKLAPKARAKPKNLKKSSAVLPKKKASTSVKVPPEFTMKQVKEIVALIKDAGIFTSFAYKTDEFEIEISVGSPSSSGVSTFVAPLTSSASSVNTSAVVSTSAPFAISASERLITSPMIGTFYRRPSPSSPPFVEVGDRVKQDTDVCIVEVMKLLNTIPAECSGTVSKILVEDGENIEAGQALMVIEVA
jgi:acetyl-CoA carboxylase biotin carboxyl carrier protein